METLKSRQSNQMNVRMVKLGFLAKSSYKTKPSIISLIFRRLWVILCVSNSEFWILLKYVITKLYPKMVLDNL